MTARNYLSITALSLVVVGWGTRGYAEGDVTVVMPPPTTNAPPVAALAPDGFPVVHKSSHKKRPDASAIAGSTSTDGAKGTASVVTNVFSSHATLPPSTISTAVIKPAPGLPPPVTPKPVVVARVVLADPPTYPGPAASAPATASDGAASLVPTVETGLPIARHSASDSSGYSAPSASYRTTLASALPPLSVVPTVLPPSPDGSSPGSYPSASGSPNYIYLPPDEQKKTRTYPWKHEIITTEFWIGEPGSTVSPTDNIESAWDENWRSSNHGSDDPSDRQGYLPAGHAPTVNPFYVALPFNDLAYPDQARRWLPDGWKRKPRDGKQVSACKDRWVEIKNQQGDTCYAQWEDVGPLTSDHPEYVFGSERPDTYTRAGLDVSPAVARFLGIEPAGKNRLTSWRFVEAEDVPPGYWLKYDEEALLFKAMHDLNNRRTPDMDDDSSIQRSIAPSDDQNQIDTNKKKIGAAKG